MKSLVLSLVTALMAVPALGATADLLKSNLQPGGYLEKARVGGGQVDVNLDSGTITLTVFRKFHCPAGAFCAQVMPAPIVISVPLKSVTVGSCGELIYAGSKDLRPVDGNLNQLTVTSNARNFCKYFVAIPATVVDYHLEGGISPIVEDDQFFATSLK